MGRSQETMNKKEVRKKKEKKRQDKEQKKLERKESGKGSGLDDMIAYVDENGMITSTPPDPSKRTKVNAEEISLSVPKRNDDEQLDPIHHGVVTFFNGSKGYGFIRDNATGESVFVHINALVDEIDQNMKVSFEIERSHKGFNAVNVRIEK